VVEPVRIRFHWRGEGPPRVRLAREKIVRFISREDYLNLRSETTTEYEDGRRTHVTSELVEARAVEAVELIEDPFRLDLPPNTPTYRQSAFDLLEQMARALARVPVFSPTPSTH
jgi:hypothetical protein